jgi:hypothetical protein
MKKNSSLISLTLRRTAAGVVYSLARDRRADLASGPIRSSHRRHAANTPRIPPWLICLFGPLASTMALWVGGSGSPHANPLP